eukprot:TRINITY_DN4304_c0_g1_i13.p1 TRINITY_DN4304_c0_g1~~TRINITY_DN4304_c0_g1_i13.p1  ORF type:complete len:159 (-),score=32.38 TRINITY_DN4304_c0_g1_i13:142-618(-)
MCIRDRYCSRVSRYINKAGIVEEKQVSDVCVIPLKEARTVLYTLCTQGFLQSQDVTHDKQTLTLYSCKFDGVIERMVPSMYKVVFNLKKRQDVEIERVASLNNSMLNYQEKNSELEKCEMTLRKLESALIELDETILLFTEFQCRLYACILAFFWFMQ